MLKIDSRTGSKELFDFFPACINPTLTTLDFGDVAFLGNGPNSTPFYIGIERKTIDDFISSMSTGRLTGYQLPGMTNTFNRSYLIIEGVWITNKEGVLCKRVGGKGGTWKPLILGPRTYMTRDILKFIFTIKEMFSVRVMRTTNIMDTVLTIRALYSWWNDKDYEDHRAHLMPHLPAIALVKPLQIVKTAMAFEGVGPELASRIADRFTTVKEMINAPLEAWLTIKGIGRRTALRILEGINAR